MILTIHTEKEMQKLAKKIALSAKPGLIIFLKGELGVGKTTFVRGFLHALGYKKLVKSPSYTLVEPYEINGHTIYHLDLYRLMNAEELEWLGVRDYFDKQSICLIEWPEKGNHFLPVADIEIHIEMTDSNRKVTIQANSKQGKLLIQTF